jgi:DNA sulfur modification protein DndC
LNAIRRELRDEYLQSHDKPWIVGFSGGKDSTLLAHLVVECLLGIAPDLRKRRVYIVSNDTLVESPVFHAFVEKLLNQLRDGITGLRLPVEVVKTHPAVEESFWVNLLGKGYPAPNRTFRWCTDRMKIRPTSRFVRQLVTKNGEAILLLGVRRSESAARSANIAKHEAAGDGRLSPHADHRGCWIFTPIKELTTDEVWITLLNSRPPWGGTYRDIVTLYKNAQGGECPFVVSTDDAPSCGSNSARFGCWTCTVVDKDNSIDALIAAGHDHLEPLAEFRQRLRDVSENPDCRSKIRRNGQPGLGPLTMPTRQQLLDELLAIQRDTGMPLISEVEVHLIRDQWAKDQVEDTFREVERAQQPLGS